MLISTTPHQATDRLDFLHTQSYKTQKVTQATIILEGFLKLKEKPKLLGA